MALTNTSTAAGGLGKTIGDAVIAFNHVNVMFPLWYLWDQAIMLILMLAQLWVMQ